MTASKKKIAYNMEWEKTAYFRPSVRFKKDLEEEIRKYSDGNLNGFIVEAVEEKIARMKLEENK